MTVEECINEAVKIFEELRPNSAILHGSQSTNTSSPHSDIDIAIDCSEYLFEKISCLIKDIPTLRRFDLLRLEEAGTEIRKEIERNGKILYKQN